MAKVIGGIETRLGQDGHLQAVIFQKAANQRDTERRVINIGIACDQEDIDMIPTSLTALFPGNRQWG